MIAGMPPDVDLVAEEAPAASGRRHARKGLEIRSAHDCAEGGGCAITLRRVHVRHERHRSLVDLEAVDAPSAWTSPSTLFSESASRVVVSVERGRLAELLARTRLSKSRRAESEPPEPAESTSQLTGVVFSTLR